MSNEILVEIACPNCLNPIDVREHGQHVTCDACNSKFILQGHLCPQCSTYHETSVRICGQCGTALQRTCRRCGTENWSGEEYCIRCGDALDILDIVSVTANEEAMRHRAAKQETIRQVRAETQAASEKRMQEFMEIERERQAQLRARKKSRQRRDGLVLGGVATAVFLLFVCAALVLFLLN